MKLTNQTYAAINLLFHGPILGMESKADTKTIRTRIRILFNVELGCHITKQKEQESKRARERERERARASERERGIEREKKGGREGGREGERERETDIVTCEFAARFRCGCGLNC